MNTYDWSSFKARININSSIASIYEMWATAAAMEKWFLRLCEFKNKDGLLKDTGDYIKTGDQYTWRWHGWPDEVTESGEILEENGTDLVRFTFGQEGAETMVCTVKIYTEEGENICEITQENIPDNEKGKTYYHIGCLTGWSFFLSNMKSILEGGVDLRNKNELLKKMINA
jgi:uncharacterized protein YndB with AHSA1/START domain